MTENASLTPQGPLEARSDFENNPKGQYKYWYTELTASEKMLRGFTQQGNEIVKRYLAEGTGARREYTAGYGVGQVDFKLNLFYANTSTLESNLYGSVPKIEVSRRYQDSNDDVGRVASEILERFLNTDVAERGYEVETVLRACLNDRLTVGLGVPRIRYTAEFSQVTGIDGEPQDILTSEDVMTEYVHWRDVRWSWSRTWKDITWIGFRAYMTKEEVSERFGEKAADKLEYKVQQALDEESVASASDIADSWQKAEIWEIWDKVKRQVVWVSCGYDRVLDTKDDPLKLTHFWPCPRFFAANITSTLYIPTADYHLVQDLYNEVDKLQTRISIITDACKVVGVYDSSSGEIQRMFKEGTDNDLIPVENWAMFAEKGGIQGQIDWFPIQDVVAALVQLVQMRDQTIALLQQVTGMSDLMRGDLKNQYEGVGQTQIKAKFGSIRIQALQDKFASFATDLMRLKAEVIAKHMDIENIAKRANVQYMQPADRDLIGPALQLIKNPDQAKLQVNIRPESVAMVDYAQLKNERTEFITALATFMQSAAPLVEMDQSATPFLLQLLQWGLAGFKGAGEVEGVIDKAIEAAEQAQKQRAQQPPEVPPEVQAEQARQQAAMQLEQFKAQAEMQKIQAKSQADVATRQADMQADIQTMMQEHQSEMERLQVDMVTKLSEIQAKLEADVEKEWAQAEANIAQTQAQAQAEIGKDMVEHELDRDGDIAKTQLKIDEIEASAAAKIKEAKSKPKPTKGGSSDA